MVADAHYRFFGASRALLAALTFLVSCTSPPPPEADAGSSCVALYYSLADTTAQAGVTDARYQRLPETPFLRTSRFWASFDSKTLSPSAYRTWLHHQNQRAIEGLLNEWRRLPAPIRRDLAKTYPELRDSPKSRLSQCGQQWIEEAEMKSGRLTVEARDHYQEWKRWLGLYPLTAIPFYRGVVAEHEKFRAQRARFAPGTDPARTWAYYQPPEAIASAFEAVTRLRQAPRDPLGIPSLSPPLRETLLTAFAPSLATSRPDNVLPEFNRPGTITVDADGAAFVDSARPTLYTHIGYGRYRGQVTLQLNYSVWFTRRPAEGRLDLLAGQWNGLTWRVHLLPSGGVIGFDKMHQCGCWYQFYPARGFRAQPRLPITQEPPFIGRSIEPFQPVRLWLESGSQHLLGMTIPRNHAENGSTLHLAPYARLRALGQPPSSTPFDDNGLIAESARLERFVFWPMGIDSPGAMRIHGTHAIAFIGERHWDDPWLLDELGVW